MASSHSDNSPQGPDASLSKVVRTDQQWRSMLDPEVYRITRQCGTERAFTGKYWNTKETGLYRCVCCGAALFHSDTKYDSGTGWPSFFQPVSPECIQEQPDHSLGLLRVEVRCRRCGAHIGHVFDDGPEPTGLRYCINSASLEFESSSSPSDSSHASQ